MPTIDGVAHPTAEAQQPQQATSLGGLDSEAFLRLLVAQMRYQDPMAPADHTAMLQQTSQFTQVETLQQVTALQQQLLGLSQAGMASELVGKEVSAVTPDGSIVGVVTAVRFTSGGPLLAVGDHEVPLQAATEIRLPSTAAAATGTGLAGQAGGAGAAGDAAPEQWVGPWSHDDAEP